MELFQQGKRFYKGNLHCHTTCSDGAKSPEEVVELYRSMGYDFLAITDHRRVTVPEPCFAGDMLVLPGIELDYAWPGEVAHIVGFGMKRDVARELDMSLGPQGGADAITRCGGRAVLAHPHWSLNTLATLTALRGVVGAEVYNSVSTLRPDSSEILDVSATHGRLYPFMAADDSHSYAPGEAGMSYILAQADSLTPDALIAAIDKGLFYASQGPRFERLAVEDNRLIVRCSPVSRIYFHTNIVWTDDHATVGEGVTQGFCRLRPEEGMRWLRCQLIDAQGRSAWSSPIAL